MAGPMTCYNFAPTNKNEFAEDALKAPIKSNSTPTLILAIFCAPTFVPA